MSSMKGVTAIAIGFINSDRSLEDVMRATIELIGRKLTINEFKNISKAYRKQKQDVLSF